MKETVGLWASQKLAASGKDGLCRVFWGGRDLQSRKDSVSQEKEVRKGASGVHRKNGG